MAILLTGGTGKTSQRVAKLCAQAGVPFVLASRRGTIPGSSSSLPHVKFDYTQESSYAVPFHYAFPRGEKIDTAYIMSPAVADPEVPMIRFVEWAVREQGVKRFVMVAGTSAQPGRKGVGKVWQRFIDLGVDFCVLRPTWFMENFTEEAPQFLIKEQSKIYSATGDAEIPFVSAEDIAACAFRVLTDTKAHNCDYRVLGPQLLTYDDIAAKVSNAVGRKVEHVKLTGEQRTQGLVAAGVDEYFAKFLTDIELMTKGGLETAENKVVQELTGQPPKDFDTFARENKGVW